MAWKRKRTTRPMRKSRKRAKRTPKKALKKTIRQVIARTAEVKQVDLYVYSDSLTFYTGGSYLPNNCFPLSPYTSYLNLSQGVSQGQRVGNKVRTVSLIMKGSLNALAYDAIYNPKPQPVIVKMWVYYAKASPTTLTPPAFDWFQLGGTSAPMTGYLTDLWAPINTDQYTVLKTKIFKIGNSIASGTGNQPGAQSYANNDYKLNALFSFNLTKLCPKIVRYNDNTTQPSSRILLMAIQCVQADGSLPASAAQTPVNLSYMMTYRYSDI